MASTNPNDNTEPDNSPSDHASFDGARFTDPEAIEPELADAELANTALTDAELSELDLLLANPVTWDEPDASIEDFLVAAIAEETQRSQTADPRDGSQHSEQEREQERSGQNHLDALPSEPGELPLKTSTAENVVSIFSRSRIVAATVPFVAGIAAALLLVVGIGTLSENKPKLEQVELALAGTELAPQAQAQALIHEGTLGVRIRLDVSGLAPSPEGTYYEAWVRKSPEVGVSAGTFHLRGGDGAIDLWAGVSTEDYPLITVTLQQEGDGPASSGKVVLKGRLEAE